ALARRAHHRDRAAVLLDDPIRDGQAQARAFADLLGGEERIEDPPLEPGRNPVPGIDERDLDRRGADRSRNANRLAWRVDHRVARVRQQVDEHLLQLDGIANDHGLLRAQVERDFDLAQSELLLHEGQRTLDYLPHGDRLTAGGGRPSKRAQMRDDLRGLPHLLHGLAQLADDLLLVRCAEFDEVERVAHEQAGVVEGVVELVGDARGELAERGELAGLDELLLFVAQLLLAPLHFGRGLPQVTHDVDHRLAAVLQTQVGPGEPAAILLVVDENMEHRLALVAEAPVDLIEVAHDVEHGAALLVPLAQAPLQRLHVCAESALGLTLLGYGLLHRAQSLHALAFRLLPQALQLLFEGDHLQLAADHDLLELLQVQDLLLQLRLGLLEVAHYLLVGPHVAQDANGTDHLAVGTAQGGGVQGGGDDLPARAARVQDHVPHDTPLDHFAQRRGEFPRFLGADEA